MDADQVSQSPKQHHNILTLPPEIRILIYKAVFEHHVYPIQRMPIPLQCVVDNRQLMAQRNLMTPASIPVCSHRECSRWQLQALDADMYVGNRALIASDHYPCSFANFTYSLKSWQVHSLKHLAFCTPIILGMETHIAEWNETLSLAGLGLRGLSTISIEIHLQYPELCWRSMYWDYGMLELDRLNLKGIRVAIYKGETTNDPFFIYSAGISPPSLTTSTTTPASHSLPVSFRHARDELRRQKNAPMHDVPRRLFLRLAPNEFPLCVRNLIHTLPLQHLSHADIRREDRYHRPYAYYYAYPEEDTEQQTPIVGFQYGDDVKENAEYIARGLARLRDSRQRLEQMAPGLGLRGVTKPEKKKMMMMMNKQSRDDVHRLLLHGREEDETERPGDWRRRLVEEAFAPFIESFPMAMAQTWPGPPSKCLTCRDGKL
ncbi:hypothetical protein BO71DRAFT_425982 [Aspergillus ellipticus CBS 707.79]|uniref:Uncharacterized protein n=1 Tax=Aspergillus ellipticus CBS 707.79 TaxID=1448320 RepID=A0A319ECM3_9EURO|nr:hypothetical protein BO71DRAFT_425982 [Aspergillus ellipticus CBS 707.79]